jgi:hypothetical protein
MITRKNFGCTYKAGDWVGRSGKASWDPSSGPAQRTGSIPAGVLPFGPARPRVMMDPSNPETWQRPYVFTR